MATENVAERLSSTAEDVMQVAAELCGIVGGAFGIIFGILGILLGGDGIAFGATSTPAVISAGCIAILLAIMAVVEGAIPTSHRLGRILLLLVPAVAGFVSVHRSGVRDSGHPGLEMR